MGNLHDIMTHHIDDENEVDSEVEVSGGGPGCGGAEGPTGPGEDAVDYSLVMIMSLKAQLVTYLTPVDQEVVGIQWSQALLVQSL